jgi:hypothetical protein
MMIVDRVCDKIGVESEVEEHGSINPNALFGKKGDVHELD